MKRKYSDDDLLAEMSRQSEEKKQLIQELKAAIGPWWIPVEERLPENEKVVLICAERKGEKKTYNVISTAFYTDGTMWSEDSAYSWYDLEVDYDDEKDDYLIPEGWWEDTKYGEEFCAVDDFVLAWMPLPEPYKPDN